jgi:hypothetical protein
MVIEFLEALRGFVTWYHGQCVPTFGDLLCEGVKADWLAAFHEAIRGVR